MDNGASRIGRSAASLAVALAAILPTLPASACGDGNSARVYGQINSAGGGIMLASDMAPEPDYEAVMAKEFRGAVEEGTSAALIRFIARHPDHPLADKARTMLAGRKGTETGSSQDPDADIYSAFEDALRQNTVGAFEVFIRHYPNHPLAAEAKRRVKEIRRND